MLALLFLVLMMRGSGRLFGYTPTFSKYTVFIACIR